MGAVVRVQANVLVQVAGVTEGTTTEAAAQRLVSGVCAQVNLQSVLASVQFAAEDADVRLGFLRGYSLLAPNRVLGRVCRRERRASDRREQGAGPGLTREGHVHLERVWLRKGEAARTAAVLAVTEDVGGKQEGDLQEGQQLA